MVTLVCFPDAPPLREFTDGCTRERCERVEWGETIACDGECEDDKVSGKREGDG